MLRVRRCRRNLAIASRGSQAEWLSASNVRTLAFAMVETRAAVEALDAILDTPGIDGTGSMRPLPSSTNTG